jgi:hypothetical protein
MSKYIEFDVVIQKKSKRKTRRKRGGGDITNCDLTPLTWESDQLTSSGLMDKLFSKIELPVTYESMIGVGGSNLVMAVDCESSHIVCRVLTNGFRQDDEKHIYTSKGNRAEFVLSNFKKIHLVEPSQGAFEVLTRKFKSKSNVSLENSTISESAIPANSLDFAMSLGVLHHISNTDQALKDINSKLNIRGLFLGYLYYKIENKPFLYRIIFSVANYFRKKISNLTFKRKKRISHLIAIFIYQPFARLSKVLNILKINTSNIPLHQYADLNLYMMKNDALDRFGTKLEKRFNQEEITKLLSDAGFDSNSIIFSASEPFWTFVAKKS